MGAWAAEWKITGVEIIANDQGHRATPSYDAFTDEELVLGDAGKSQVARNTNLRASGYSVFASQSSTAATMAGSALYWIGICRCGRQRAFKSRTSTQAIDVGINGFGRIG